MILCHYFEPLLEEGILQMADTMKALLYHENPVVFEQIDFDNDTAFLEPMLFAYFNRNQPYSLESILQPYYKTLPDGISSPAHQGKKLTNGICILNNQHPLLAHRFRNMDDDSIAEVEISQTAKYHVNHIQEGFDIISNHLPVLHNEILKTNRNVVIFHNPNVLCFVTVEVNGTIFLTTIPENEAIFFLEELIHQCSHNTFNAILFDKNKFFKQDIENMLLGDVIGHKGEERTIFSAIHGLYTVAKRYEAFYPLYQKDVFKGRQKHEFLGRFADIKKRFRTGLELLNQDEFFTNEGKKMYEVLDHLCFDTIQKVPELDGLFDLSNQPSEFSYAKFCELNPIERFNF